MPKRAHGTLPSRRCSNSSRRTRVTERAGFAGNRFHEAMTYRVDLQGGVRRGARDRPGAGLRAQRDRAGRHAPARAQSIARRDPRSGSLRVTKEDEKSGGSLCEPDGWRRKRGDDERASDVRFARIEDAGRTRTEAARDIGLVTVLRVRRPASARVTLRPARAPRASPKPRRTESRARTLIQMISARLFARSGERRATDPRSIESLCRSGKTTRQQCQTVCDEFFFLFSNAVRTLPPSL